MIFFLFSTFFLWTFSFFRGWLSNNIDYNDPQRRRSLSVVASKLSLFRFILLSFDGDCSFIDSDRRHWGVGKYKTDEANRVHLVTLMMDVCWPPSPKSHYFNDTLFCGPFHFAIIFPTRVFLVFVLQFIKEVNLHPGGISPKYIHIRQPRWEVMKTIIMVAYRTVTVHHNVLKINDKFLELWLWFVARWSNL